MCLSLFFLSAAYSAITPGPGQQYAIQTRKHIAALHRARPDITIEIQWYPAHKGIAGNVKADERAKIAAEEPDTRGVEWRKYSDRTEVRAMPLPQSLANLKRKISEKKWVEACQWAGGRISKKKYRMQKSQRPDSTVAGSTKEACLAILPDQDGALSNRTVPQLDEEPAHPAMLVVPTPEPDPEASLQGVTGVEGPAKDPVGGGAEGDREGTGRGKDRWKIRDPLADERCRRAVLDFLSTTDGEGRAPVEKDTVSEAPEAELQEFLEEHGAGAEELVTVGTPMFLPTPSFMAWRPQERARRFHLSFLLLSFLFHCHFLGAPHFLGTSLGEGQWRACNEPPLRGQRTGNGLYIISS